jgi:hypothetical protein
MIAIVALDVLYVICLWMCYFCCQRNNDRMCTRMQKRDLQSALFSILTVDAVEQFERHTIPCCLGWISHLVLSSSPIIISVC